MNGEKNGFFSAGNGIFNAGFALAVALVLSAIIGSWAIIRVKSRDQTIVVTGSARKRIKSDLVIWRAGVSYEATQLADAYKSLSNDVPRVKHYLISKGIPENEITISAITSQTLHAKSTDGEGGEDSGRITGYSLKQELEVRSTDVDKIEKLAREATELINQGILIESNAPEYHYTKLGDLKIEMLSEAAKDAKLRAQQIASSTGSSIGSMRSARMGVLQITPADSNDVSGEGMNDTSSLDKDITAVVNVTFAVD
ncbi:MAG TPA: SIMPL domain-containing protein [Pyrinomonadaceae bacterium]|nr:SIMPL domain-containing protein [Pyrinomonadaceae bacterium]